MGLSNDSMPGNGIAGRKVEAYLVADGVVIYEGALVGLDKATGYAVNWSDVTASTVALLGIAMRRITGDVPPPTGSETPEVEVDCSGVIIKKLSITGGTTQTQVGDEAYASDESTYTMSAPAGAHPIGCVTRLYSDGKMDLRLYSAAEFRARVNS